MPFIDIAVLILIVTGTFTASVLLWRRGLRRQRFLVAGWLSFFGVVVVAMMVGHCVDILYNLIVGGTARDGSPWTYNFKTYALYLLAAVLIRQGVAVLRAAWAFSEGDPAFKALGMRAAGMTLLVVVPLLTIQVVFAVIFTTLSIVSLLVLAVWREELVATRRSEEPIAVAA